MPPVGCGSERDQRNAGEWVAVELSDLGVPESGLLLGRSLLSSSNFP